ncbi:SDR family oxidoreductase [Mycobacterium sp. NPDC050551]|uniref:SDR family oxidoreductase n=1 Tax=Mycobacterium sp. NPDC050551 TaxID=3155407 RepID=UPI0034326D0E
MYASIFRPGLFDGQTVVVTGGGSGIGRCVAHELASLGAEVVITGRKLEKLRRTADEIHEDGGNAAVYDFDVRDEDAVRSAVAAILREHNHIDGLVNNAGGQFPMPAEAISKKGWETVLATNLTGGFLVSREVYGQAMKAGGGAIVNMLANVWDGMPLMAHSGAARAGMLNLTQTLALEWAPGVRVNAVAPGYVASSGLDTYDPDIAGPLVGASIGVTPLKRFAQEAEVAAAIVYLLSPAAAYLTGSCIRIDGGASLNPNAMRVGGNVAGDAFRGFHRAVEPEVLRTRIPEDAG